MLVITVSIAILPIKEIRCACIVCVIGTNHEVITYMHICIHIHTSTYHTCTHTHTHINIPYIYKLNSVLCFLFFLSSRSLSLSHIKVALLWEGDDPSDIRRITYKECLREVCRIANGMRSLGVKRGDCVCIYMPMVPEAGN